MATLSCSIAYRNVSFKYPGTEKYALRNVSFKIGAGHLCVGLVPCCMHTHLIDLLGHRRRERFWEEHHLEIDF